MKGVPGDQGERNQEISGMCMGVLTTEQCRNKNAENTKEYATSGEHWVLPGLGR